MWVILTEEEKNDVIGMKKRGCTEVEIAKKLWDRIEKRRMIKNELKM